MMLRSSDYQPVNLPLASMSKLGFDHWRTEWRAPEKSAPPSPFADLLGNGFSTWEISTRESCIWLAWDWVILTGGVIALTNPLEIRSNAMLLGEGYRHLPRQDSSAILVSLIHDLPWRDEVESLLAQALRAVH